MSQEFQDLHSQVINPDALAASNQVTPSKGLAKFLPPLFRLFNWPAYNCPHITVPVVIQTSSALFVAGDPSISYLLIQNNGAGNVFYATGRDATNLDLVIAPGGNYEPLRVPTNGIYLMATVAATPAVIIYGKT